MKLDSVRKKIDLIDEKILQILAERLCLAKEAKRLKTELGLPIEDKKREQEVLNMRVQIGKKLGLSNHFVKKLFSLIIAGSKKIQETI